MVVRGQSDITQYIYTELTPFNTTQYIIWQLKIETMCVI